MNIRSKLIQSLMIASLLAPLFLIAENEERVPVGTRPPKPNQDMQEAPTNERMECGYIFDRYPPVHLASSLHWFTKLTTSNATTVDLGEIEDGSIWKFNPYDGYKALNWLTTDPQLVVPLTVTQNFSWFSNYKYRIINRNTGESIETNLQGGPLKDSPYARFITAIDPHGRVIVLSDNTRYEVSLGDSAAFRDWALFDYIIKGQNGGWSSSYESLLINVNMDNFVHAKEVY